MNLKLYEVAEGLRDLLDQVDPETGELPAEFPQARALVATKMKGAAAYILESEMQTDMLVEHAKNVIARVKAQRKRTAWLREYLASHMKACSITDINGGLFKIKLYIDRDKVVNVFDADQLPAIYLREIPATFEPDKPRIHKAIEAGLDVPGAKIDPKDRLVLG